LCIALRPAPPDRDRDTGATVSRCPAVASPPTGSVRILALASATREFRNWRMRYRRYRRERGRRQGLDPRRWRRWRWRRRRRRRLRPVGQMVDVIVLGGVLTLLLKRVGVTRGLIEQVLVA